MAGMMAPPDEMAMQADGNMQAVPPGSLPHEVADDIDAKLSEGEFVVPADVVRWHGLKALMAMRDEAKQGLAEMDADGQIGGGRGTPALPEMPEEPVPPSTGLMGFAEGGVVPGSRESLADQAAGGTHYAHQVVNWDGEKYVNGNLAYKKGDPTQIAQQGQSAADALNKYVSDHGVDKSKIKPGEAGVLYYNNAGRNVSARDLYDSVIDTQLKGLGAPTAAAPAAAHQEAPVQRQEPIQSTVNVPTPEQSTTPGELTYDKKDNHFAQTPYTPEQFAAKEQQFTNESALKREADARAARESAEEARRTSAYQAGQGQYNNPTTGLGGATTPVDGPTTQLPQQPAGANMADAYTKLGQSLSGQNVGMTPNGSQLYTPYSGMVQMPQAQYQQPPQRFAAGGLAAPKAPELRTGRSGGVGDDSTNDPTHGAGTHEYDDNKSFMDNMAAFGDKVATGLSIAGTMTSPLGAALGIANAALTGQSPVTGVGGTFSKSSTANLKDIADSLMGRSSQGDVSLDGVDGTGFGNGANNRDADPTGGYSVGSLSSLGANQSYGEHAGIGNFGGTDEGFGFGGGITSSSPGSSGAPSGDAASDGHGSGWAVGGFVKRRC